uniref:Cilia- and flagella-associated protein 91 n=1 Tax=Eptatretus burgeri TaxID=7764 RepID=A0A8C4QUI3_EPTBU
MTARTERHVRSTRALDFAYDPEFLMSSHQDHERHVSKQTSTMSRVERVPNFRNMFSVLPHYPSYTLQRDSPLHYLPRLETQWNHSGMTVRMKTDQVTDPHQFSKNISKFYKRAVISQQFQVHPFAHLETNRLNVHCIPGDFRGSTDDCAVRSVAVQTDYRDGEAQTEPYTPPYILTNLQDKPEVLHLTSLRYGHGLPAGLATLELVEHKRSRRAVELHLPPIADPDGVARRRHLLEQLERRDVAFRSKQIDNIQAERFQLLYAHIQQRIAHHHVLAQSRFNSRYQSLQAQHEDRIKKVQSKYVRAIRKITVDGETGEATEEGFIGLDAAGRAKYKSVLESFEACLSQPPRKKASNNVVRSTYLHNDRGLLELESSRCSIRSPFIPRPPEAPRPLKSHRLHHLSSRRISGYEAQLEAAQKDINDAKKAATAGGIGEKSDHKRLNQPLRFLEKIEKPPLRPPTPTLSSPDEEAEMRYQSVTFLQQLIRGRAAQMMAYYDLQKRGDLIAEMRSTHGLQPEEQRQQRLEQRHTLALQRNQSLHLQRSQRVSALLLEVEGAFISSILTHLANDIVLYLAESKASFLAEHALKLRSLREAREAGCRQQEERRRRQTEECFRQVVHVHQKCIGDFLQPLMVHTGWACAERQAEREVSEWSARITQEPDRHSKQEAEEFVSELVHGFLLPEVDKIVSGKRAKSSELHGRDTTTDTSGPSSHHSPPPPSSTPLSCLQNVPTDSISTSQPLHPTEDPSPYSFHLPPSSPSLIAAHSALESSISQIVNESPQRQCPSEQTATESHNEPPPVSSLPSSPSP